MRKQTILAAGLLFLPLLFCAGRAMAGFVVTGYTISTEELQVHTFSPSATTFNFEENTNMDRLWLGPENIDTIHTFSYSEPKPSTHTGIPLGFSFDFASVEARYIGITAAGCLYFGSGSSIEALANPEKVVVNMTYYKNLNNFIYLRFGYLNSVSTGGLTVGDTYKTQSVYAGEGAKVQYEITADGVYIGYENLRISDYNAQNDLLVSFQYFIDKEENVTYIPVSVHPTSAPERITISSTQYTESNHYSISLALVGTERGENLFISDYAGGRQAESNNPTIGFVPLTSTQYPEKSIRFSPPESCEAVSDNAVVRWDYDLNATDITFSASGGGTDWNEGNKILLVLSQKSVLEGSDLPENKTEYSYGDKIGSSDGVLVGNIKTRHAPLYSSVFPRDENVFANLSPATTYYIHAFPYKDDCSNGPVYKTTDIASDTVTTFAVAPKKLEASDVTQNSFTLTVDSTSPYLLLVSPKELPAGTLLPLEGSYEKGQKINYRLIRNRGQGSSIKDTLNYVFEVVEADGTSATVAVTDAAPATDYYYYCWTNVNHGRIYSRDFASCGISTVHPLGSEGAVRLDFSSAVTSVSADGSAVPAPAGWSYDKKNSKMFTTGESSIGNTIKVPLMAGTDGPAWSAAVSPVIDKGSYSRVSATVELFFTSESMNESTAYTPAAKDSVIVEYRNVGQDKWNRVAAATKDNSINRATGAVVLETPEFEPGERFQFRIAVRSEYEPGSNLSTPYASLRAINVEPVLLCEKVENLRTVESELLDTIARITWDDGNIVKSYGYLLRSRAGDTGDWTSLEFTSQPEYVLKGLRPLTEYTVEVATVCTEGDTSLSRSINFATVGGLPYRFTPECCVLPTGVRIGTGAVPATGAVELSDIPAGYKGWELQSYKIPSAEGYGVGLDRMSEENTANDLWFILPPVSLGNVRGNLDMTINMLAWAINADDGADAQSPRFKASDRFEIYLSADGNFSAADKVGSLDLTALSDTARDFTVHIPVTGGKIYPAIYTKMTLPSLSGASETYLNTLMINSIDMELGETVCEAVSNIRQSNLGKTSIDISWSGEAEEFALIYKPRSESVYDTAYTFERSITLKNLIPGTGYEYRIFGYCEPGRHKPGEISPTRYFNTIPECVTPVISIVNITWYSVTVAVEPLSGNSRNRLYDIWVTGYEDDARYHYKFSHSYDTVTINNIFNLGPGDEPLMSAPFSIKCRAVCSEGDSSAWSETVNFVSEDLPGCGSVKNVKTEIDFDLRIAEMTWTSGENNIYQMVLYKKSSASQYDTGWSDNDSYRIVNLELNTAYNWRIIPYCHQYYTGAPSSGSFSTVKPLAAESAVAFENAFKVRVSRNRLVIDNPAGFYVRAIEVYSVDGRLQRRYEVNSTDNVLLWHDLQQGPALIRIMGEDGAAAVRKTVIL